MLPTLVEVIGLGEKQKNPKDPSIFVPGNPAEFTKVEESTKGRKTKEPRQHYVASTHSSATASDRLQMEDPT